MLTDEFCNDSNSNNKINNIIRTIIFAPKVTLHKEHVFFYKYKVIHRMILYTTYNKYGVSYILLFERMCV